MSCMKAVKRSLKCRIYCYINAEEAPLCIQTRWDLHVLVVVSLGHIDYEHPSTEPLSRNDAGVFVFK